MLVARDGLHINHLPGKATPRRAECIQKVAGICPLKEAVKGFFTILDEI
jgi:hypothetical protein